MFVRIIYSKEEKTETEGSMAWNVVSVTMKKYSKDESETGGSMAWKS